MSFNQLELDYSIVAFVDILGFSNMVRSDCENQNGAFRYFEILRQLNEDTRRIGECSITQFSDSVIFALPLSQDNYLKIIEILADYQKELLYHSIICRGAIAYGKHYKENDFMFSQALIEAYQLESREAINPRIILSENLIEYFKPYAQLPEHIIRERDGFYFIDYLEDADRDLSYERLKEIDSSIGQQGLGVKEKYYWLYKYWEYKFNNSLPFSAAQFSKVDC